MGRGEAQVLKTKTRGYRRAGGRLGDESVGIEKIGEEWGFGSGERSPARGFRGWWSPGVEDGVLRYFRVGQSVVRNGRNNGDGFESRWMDVNGLRVEIVSSRDYQGGCIRWLLYSLGRSTALVLKRKKEHFDFRGFRAISGITVFHI